MRFLPFVKGKKGYQFAGGGFDSGGGGGGDNHSENYNLTEQYCGTYLGTPYYKRSFVLTDDTLITNGSWTLLDDIYGIDQAFKSHFGKLLKYELSVDDSKVSNMSALMYGDISGIGFYVLLEYGETFRENESVLTLYYTKTN